MSQLIDVWRSIKRATRIGKLKIVSWSGLIANVLIILVVALVTHSAFAFSVSAGNFTALYTFYGPQQASMQMFLAPNNPYQPEFAEKITRSHIAPIDYIKGKEPNTLSIVLHTTGCDVTTNYRLAEPGKVYEQTVSAVGPSCGEDQRAVAEYGLKDGPKLGSFTRN